jgi:hypothetical protein
MAPAAAGVHEHVARNGLTVDVATAAQPAMVALAAVKFTVPATLVVAMMLKDPSL